jgi:hypothetical protein
LLGMQCSAPRVVPVHDCSKSQWGAHQLSDWVSLSSGILSHQFVGPGSETERFLLLSTPQRSAPDTYTNEILSTQGWVWKGNVIVAHESGVVTGEALDWVSTNLDALRYMLTTSTKPTT